MKIRNWSYNLNAHLLLWMEATTVAALFLTLNSGCNPLGNTSESSSTDTAVSTVIRPTTFTYDAPTSVVAGLCSSAFTLTASVGLGGQAALVSANTTVLLTTSASGGFYSDASCGSLITSIDIAKNQSTVSVYFKSNTAETVTLTAMATVEGTAVSRSGPMTISAAVPYSVALTQAVSTSGQVSTSFATQPIVTLKDSTGATYSTTNNVVTTAYTDATCATAASGVISNGTVAAVAGVGTFASLSYSQAESIYLKYTFSTEAVSSSCVGPIAITTPCDAAGIAATPFASGDGSLASPYLICTTAQWNNIAATAGYMSKYFELKANLDFGSAAANFTPIANNGTAFTGQLDGNDYTISNVVINGTNGGNESKSGMFRNLGAGAYIHDLTINNVSYTQTVAGNSYMGAVVGWAQGSGWPANGGNTNVVRISNITVTGAVTVTNSTGSTGDGGIGGFAGILGNTVVSGVTLNASSGSITAPGCYRVGGLIGYGLDGGSVALSSTNLPIANADHTVGGFLGYNNGCSYSITTSKASGNVTARYGYLGGFQGTTSCNAAITQSIATGTVTRTDTGTWYGSNYGGFCGGGCNATNCFATGDVRTQDTLSTRKGGFCGGSCTITNSYSTGNTMYNSGGGVYVQDNTSAETGGLCGQSAGCTVVNSYWDSTLATRVSTNGGTGVSTATLKDPTFLISNGWNFASIWRTPPALPSVYNNSDYPIFQWQTSGYTLPTVASLLASGTGTSVDPYLISSAADLRNIPYAMQIDSNVALAYFKIPNATTIDLTGLPAPAIGNSTTPFRGHFDGNNQTISNLSTTSMHSYSGTLFNYLGAGAYVHDLNISNVTMVHNAAGYMYTGGVVGYAAGSAWDAATICDGSTLASATTASSTKVRICNIAVTGAVTVSVLSNSGNAGFPGVGGFIGAMTNTAISNVSIIASSGGITAAGNQFVGGFLGYAISRNSIAQSTADVDILSSHSRTGGFIGYQYDGVCTQTTVTTSRASGDVNGSGGFLGGFFGDSNCWAGNPITYSVATGNVTSTTASWANYYVGGFCGGGCDAYNSYSIGDVRAEDAAADRRGGFCGGGCHITNSYSRGDVLYKSGGVYVKDTGSVNSGGLCGGTGGAGNCTVSNSFWDSDTSLSSSIGGGTGKTTVQMQTAATLDASGANWSTAIWNLSDGSYPKLQWEPVSPWH